MPLRFKVYYFGFGRISFNVGHWRPTVMRVMRAEGADAATRRRRRSPAARLMIIIA